MIHSPLRAGLRLAIALVLLAGPARSQSLVFIVRHAERADGGASGMQAQNDPPLSPRGEARALKLAEMLKDAGIAAIFVTEFRRTQDTAKPLAVRLGLTSQQVSSRDIEGLAKELRSKKPSENALVVGHSNTLPAIIKALGGPDVSIGEGEYDNLLIVIPKTGKLTRLRFTP